MLSKVQINAEEFLQSLSEWAELNEARLVN